MTHQIAPLSDSAPLKNSFSFDGWEGRNDATSQTEDLVAVLKLAEAICCPCVREPQRLRSVRLEWKIFREKLARVSDSDRNAVSGSLLAVAVWLEPPRC